VFISKHCQIYSLTSGWHCLNIYGLSLCMKDLYYLHRFVTRPDVKQKYLGDFLDWCLTTISQTSEITMEGTVTLDGALQSLVSLQSHGGLFMFSTSSLFFKRIKILNIQVLYITIHKSTPQF